MRKLLVLVLATAAALSPAPALAQVGNFTIVNATGIDMTGLAARRFGTAAWLPLVVTPVPVVRGGRGAVQFNAEDCVFDLRATLPDGQTVLWQNLNLCEAKVVTLNRDARGQLWVDYQ